MVWAVGEYEEGEGYLDVATGSQHEPAHEDDLLNMLIMRNCEHGFVMALCSLCSPSQPHLDAGDEAHANSLSQQDIDIQREHVHAETQQESLQATSDEPWPQVDTVSLDTEPIALAHAAAASPRETEEAAVQDLSATSRRTEDRVQEPTREKRMVRHNKESQNEAPLPASNRKERGSHQRNPADVDEHSPLGKSAPEQNNLTADQVNLCRPPEGGVCAMPSTTCGSPRPDAAVVSMPGMAVRSPPPKPQAQSRAGTSRADTSDNGHSYQDVDIKDEATIKRETELELGKQYYK